MRTLTLFALLAMPLSANSISIVNNCTGNDVCTASGSVSGFGTTVFSAVLTAMGNNITLGNDPGPGGSGSVTIDETGMTDGPVRAGFIEFSYGPTGTASSGAASAAGSFSVGAVTGTVPGEVGVPLPLDGQFEPFTLGEEFDITSSVSFLVPATPLDQYGSAEVDFSFSLFEAVTLGNGSTFAGAAVTIEDPPTVPEPGTIWTVALALALLAARRAASSSCTTSN